MMTSVFETEAQKKIWQLLQDMNDAWVKGHPENLVKFFHEDIVIVGPDFQKMGDSRQACVKSYKDFCSQATVHDFKEMDPRIYVYGNTAIATYSYKITYEMNGETHYRLDEMCSFSFVKETNGGRYGGSLFPKKTRNYENG